jgi:hypothetical protein
LTLDGGEWSASRPGRFIPGEEANGARWIGGWMDPRVSLKDEAKRIIPYQCRESNPGREARSQSLQRLFKPALQI